MQENNVHAWQCHASNLVDQLDALVAWMMSLPDNGQESMSSLPHNVFRLPYAQLAKHATTHMEQQRTISKPILPSQQHSLLPKQVTWVCAVSILHHDASKPTPCTTTFTCSSVQHQTYNLKPPSKIQTHNQAHPNHFTSREKANTNFIMAFAWNFTRRPEPWAMGQQEQTNIIATTALKRSKHNLHFHNMHSHNCLPTCHCRLHVFLEGTSERNYPQLAASLQEMAEGHNVGQNGQSAPHSPSGCLSQALYKHQTWTETNLYSTSWQDSANMQQASSANKQLRLIFCLFCSLATQWLTANRSIAASFAHAAARTCDDSYTTTMPIQTHEIASDFSQTACIIHMHMQEPSHMTRETQAMAMRHTALKGKKGGALPSLNLRNKRTKHKTAKSDRPTHISNNIMIRGVHSKATTTCNHASNLQHKKTQESTDPCMLKFANMPVKHMKTKCPSSAPTTNIQACEQQP